MTPDEEAARHVRNGMKLHRSMVAWQQVCHLAQVHDEKTGHYKMVDPYELLDIFNRMMMDHLRIDGKV